MKSAWLAVFLMLSACGSSSTTAHVSPIASATVATSPGTSPSAAASGTSGASPSPAGIPPLVHCTSSAPATDNLVIGTITGSATVVVRDIQDTAHARNLCTFDSGAANPQFVSGSQVSYSSGGQILKANLAGGAAQVMASGIAAGFMSGLYSISPDGQAVTYLSGTAWHLGKASGDRVLTTLPAVPGRGISPNQDDAFLSFSPDGLYIALFQTFAMGGTGETAPDQIRLASDGSLVYSTSGMTMAVWSSVPSRLFFRDQTALMQRWDPSTGVSGMPALLWILPRSSPDGRWIAYTFRGSTGTGGIGDVGLYSVQANAVVTSSPSGRSGVRFLNNFLVWYIGERACDTCFGGQPTPTGVTYIYDIAGASEVASRLTSVLDSWPHVTTPGI